MQCLKGGAENAKTNLCSKTPNILVPKLSTRSN